MKLCLVTPGFSASEDDWCIPALHHLVRRLAADHEVTVIALRHPPRRDEYRFFGARVLPFAAGTRTGVWRAVVLLRALAAVGREHRRSPFDVIHGLWADEAGFVAATAGRRLGIRSVVSVMGGELVGFPDIGYGVQLGRTGHWLVRRSLARANRITVGSTALVDAVHRQDPSLEPVVAPLGVDTTLFRAEGECAPLAGDPCLLQVGSLVPVKDQRLTLMAFARVVEHNRGAHLHFVGDGSLRQKLATRVRALDLGERVHFHGHVPHNELPLLYRVADLHVVSSRFESQGMAVLEAAACGTGTVGTDVGILPDLGLAAVTSPVNDPGALAAVLLERLERRSRVCELGDAASELVRRELDLESCMARLVAAYSGTAGANWNH